MKNPIYLNKVKCERCGIIESLFQYTDFDSGKVMRIIQQTRTELIVKEIELNDSKGL